MKNRKSGLRRYSVVLSLALILLSASMARAAAGDVDLSFNAGAVADPQLNSEVVRAVVVQPDGKIIIGGHFTSVGGVARNGVARLNADGSVDTTFVPPFFPTDDFVFALRMALQPDGKIVVAGNNFRVGGNLYSLVRLNADGSLDASFSLPVINSSLVGLALQPDGKILVGGDFGSINNVERRIAARLNSDGTLDASFSAGLPFADYSGRAFAFAVAPDGRIIAGGALVVTVGTTTFRNVVRFNSNGTPDASLNVAGDSLDEVHAVVLQTDGKILLGGNSSGNSGSRNSLTRVNPDGSRDSSFNSAVALGGQVYDVLLEPTGKVIAAGNFCATPFAEGCNLSRFNIDGSRDAFYPVNSSCANNYFENTPVALARQADGKILVGGYFNTVSCYARQRIVRLFSDTVLPNLTVNNAALNEGSGGTTAFNFTVNLSAASERTVTVNYATADGTASAPADYQAASGTLTFAAGETGKTITILVNGDTTVEANETFTVNLTSATNAAIAGAVGTGTILNDDSCAYSISPSSLNIGASGGAGNTFAVTTQAECVYAAVSGNSFITINSGASGTGNGTIIFTVAANTGAARTGTITVGGKTFRVNQAASATFRRTPFDFDGDGRADISVYRPNTGTWYFLDSTDGFKSIQWGINTDKIVPADYDGDGKTDVAIYRPNTGTWYILNAAGGFSATQWGISTDIPVPADYDGDGKADIAVWRPSSGVWFVQNATGGYSATQWGVSTDVPVPADYDGDGKTDVAIFRPNTGVWYILKSNGTYASTQFGISTDVPVAADYDGDGKADIAVYRPNTGVWFILNSAGTFSATQWGVSTDIPVPADYDGDGKANISVYRPNNGVWFILDAAGGYNATQWGVSTDVPVAAAFKRSM